MLRYINIFFVVLSAIISINANNKLTSNVSAIAKLDSTSMIMGSKTALRVEFVGEFGDDAHTYINHDEWKLIEISETDSAQLNTLGSNRRELRAMFMIQAFDSGLHTLPPIYLVAGDDTIASNSPILKVDPIALDTANVIFKDGEAVDIKVHDFTDVVDAEEKFFDFVPDWVSIIWPWVLLCVILLGILLFVYYKWLRFGQIPLMPIKKPTPPYNVAIEKLNELYKKQLWQKGAEKEYYTQLTDILRGYLFGRFGINAMEMTTAQIMKAINDNDETIEFKNHIEVVLRNADFVKFAKAKPSAPENEDAYASVRDFVEQTKPQEPQEGAETINTTEKQNVNNAK